MNDHEEDVVMWVRLPRPMGIDALKKMGLTSASCYGGDSCIAAASPRDDVGIVVSEDLGTTLRKAGFLPQAGCFGGDTCIV